jgi:hypothetical protein
MICNKIVPRNRSLGPGNLLLDPEIRSFVPGSNSVPKTSIGGPRTFKADPRSQEDGAHISILSRMIAQKRDESTEE